MSLDTRDQVSSTWCLRATRVAELYLFNKEAGGNRAHISFHKDGRCHFKVEDPLGRGHVIAEWELPEPLEPTGMLRLASVLIPHRGLVVPEGFEAAEPDTVLIPPPVQGRCIQVDVLVEPGPVPKDAWPGQTSELRTKLVGRFSLYSESPDEGLLHFTLVSSYQPEGDAPRALSRARVEIEGVRIVPTNLRTVLFDRLEVDGHHLPVLTEMPIGHMPDPS
jgi:hypothetical protein